MLLLRAGIPSTRFIQLGVSPSASVLIASLSRCCNIVAFPRKAYHEIPHSLSRARPLSHPLGFKGFKGFKGWGQLKCLRIAEPGWRFGFHNVSESLEARSEWTLGALSSSSSDRPPRTLDRNREVQSGERTREEFEERPRIRERTSSSSDDADYVSSSAVWRKNGSGSGRGSGRGGRGSGRGRGSFSTRGSNSLRGRGDRMGREVGAFENGVGSQSRNGSRDRESSRFENDQGYEKRSDGFDRQRGRGNGRGRGRGRGRGLGNFGGVRGGKDSYGQARGDFRAENGPGQGMRGRGSLRGRGRGASNGFRDRDLAMNDRYSSRTGGRDAGDNVRAVDVTNGGSVWRRSLHRENVDEDGGTEFRRTSRDYRESNADSEYSSYSERGGRGRGRGRGESRDYRESNANSEYSSYRSESERGGRGRGRGRGDRGTGRGRGRGPHFSRGAGGSGTTRGDRQVRPQSGQRAEGEEKWQWMVRKKKTNPKHAFDFGKLDDDEDMDEGVDATGEEEGTSGIGENAQGEEWRRKKIGWLCKEIPTLKPTGVVTILNAQRSWITAVDAKQVIDRLLHEEDILRAHRVLKWMMQQPWYENDFELNTKIANMLGSKGKLTRMQELFDTIIENGTVPHATTFDILLAAYIEDRTAESLDEAFKIYNQMEQFGGHEQSPALAYDLFQAFTDRAGGAHIRHLHQADALFESIKKKGAPWTNYFTTEKWKALYTALIHLHSVQYNGERVAGLINDMKDAGIELQPDCYTAMIRVCSRDGNVEKAEEIFEDLLRSGHKPGWRAYMALIQTYGMAGMAAKALETFDSVEAAGAHLNHNLYEAIIEAMTRAGDVELAKALLQRAEVTYAGSLQASYNSVMELYLSKDMLSEIETLFVQMKEKGCRPNHQSYNVLIDSYLKRAQLEKAEEVYEEMKALGGIRPNLKTYSLLIEAFGRAERHAQVKKFYEHLTARKLELPAEAKPFVTEVVGEKKVVHEEKARPRKLVKEQREMLVGVSLAGARIESRDSDRTYEFHFELDMDTLVGSIMMDHLYSTFSDWAQQEPCVEVHDDPNIAYGQKRVGQFATVSHGSFRFYAHQYRPQGTPIIPRLVHRWLNPRSLAYWFMYGGGRSEATGGIYLNGSQYTPKELGLVVKALQAKSVDCERKKRKSGYDVCFKGKSAIWLWKLMEPHILEELKESLRPEDKEVTDDRMVDDTFEHFDDESVEEEAVVDGGRGRYETGEGLVQEEDYERNGTVTGAFDTERVESLDRVTASTAEEEELM